MTHRKALVLDGFEDECSTRMCIHNTLMSELNLRGLEVKWVDLDRLRISPCRGCFGCWIKTPGICVIDDDAVSVTRLMAQCDLLVYLTPIVFGGVSPVLKSILDRSICMVHPFFQRIRGETHHRKRYERYAPMIAIGIMCTSDPEEGRLFEQLMHRISINHLSPAHSSVVLSESLLSETTTEASHTLSSMLGSLIDTVEVKGE
ncbi:MAG: flavodoxin family protein [Candidatus Thorarchaeota archaeon]